MDLPLGSITCCHIANILNFASIFFVDDAIERFRHDISTMGPLGDISPINVRFVRICYLKAECY